MLCVRAQQSFMVLSDRCSVLVFHIAAVFALIHSCRGQSEVVGPLQPVVALIGDDIMLPCNLDPVMDASDMTVEWGRPDLDPRFVLVWRDGVDLESKKHPSYTSRTSLFTDELKNGNISLKISKVKLSDEGTYRCLVPELNIHTTVQLVVGAASSPAAEINRTNSSSRVVLQCESAGWYPEPELLWLDGEGNLLSAGSTKTLRGPDDLYTVSSRVTVEKRHSNNITCRVQQRNTNQSRETHIHVPDDFFIVVTPSSPPSNPTSNPNVAIVTVIGVAVVLVVIVAVFVLWKWRRDKFRIKQVNEEEGFQVVVEDGESDPLLTAKEEENNVQGRRDQSHEDKRESKDECGLETEQTVEVEDNQQKIPEEIKEQQVLLKEEKNSVLLITDQQTKTDKKTQGQLTGERQTMNDVKEKRPIVMKKSQKKNVEPVFAEQQKQRKNQREGNFNQRRNLQSEMSTGREKNDSEINTEKDQHHQPALKGNQTPRSEIQPEDEKDKEDKQRNEQRQECGLETEQNVEVETQKKEKKNLSVITETVSQFTTEQKTHEEEETTGREVETVRSEGEGEKTIEQVKDNSDLQPSLFTGKQPELERVAETFHFNLSTDQKPHRETDTQQERPTESDVDIKQSDDEKKKMKKTNKQEKNKKEAQKKKEQKKQREELEAKLQREEKQRKLQSQAKTEREKDETEINTQTHKDKQHDLESKKQDKSEREAQEKHSDKKQEDTSQKDNMDPTFSNNFAERTALKTKPDSSTGENQEKIPEEIKEQQVLLNEEKNSVLLFTDQQTKTDKKTQGQLTGERQTMNDVKEKQPIVMKKSQKKNVEPAFAEQQKQRRNQREGNFNQRRTLQSEMSTGREKNDSELNTEKDQHHQPALKGNQTPRSEIQPEDEKDKEDKQRKLQSQAKTEREKDETEINTQRDKDRPRDKSEREPQEKHSDWKQQEETSEKDNMSPTVTNNVTKRTALKTMRDSSRQENQMKLQSQTRTEGEKDTELNTQKDQHHQPALKGNQTPRSEIQPEDEKDKADKQRNERIAETQRSEEDNMISPGSSKVTEKLRRAESKEGGQEDVMDFSTDETQRKDEEKEKLQIYKATTKQQLDINQKIVREQLQESVSVTERGADCLGGLMEKELTEADQTPNSDRKNMKRQKGKPERELHEVRQLTTRKAKNQSGSRTQIRKNSKILKESMEEEKKSDQMQDDDKLSAIVKMAQLRPIVHSEMNEKGDMEPMDH